MHAHAADRDKTLDDARPRTPSLGGWIIPNPGPAVSAVIVAMHDLLRSAVAAYLARFKGQSRIHTQSDLRGYLT
jgi:hypothetical protein